ncbi:hypothetical protein MNV49_006608 [Pseudohyphozyma bogoriensis]|nr:hypothetical protein MNV49_006608 [Pseudohyphozyma bogoriensis]
MKPGSPTLCPVKPLAPLDPDMLTIQENASPASIPDSSTLQFGKTFTPHMLTARWTLANGWEAPEIKPYGPLCLDPASTVFHYAPTLFEGMKAYKDKDGRARLFRPDMNFARFQKGCARLAFPIIESDVLLELVKKLVALDEEWIPTDEGCSLYIRPTMIGTRASLGVGPSDEVLFFIICSPVGRYYPTGAKPVALYASTKDTRACTGGTGAYKFGANYAGGIVPAQEAAKLGYQQVLWLYGADHMVTEVGMMNCFVLIKREDGTHELVTPPLDDIILPGVTRDSVLQIARVHANNSMVYRFEGLPYYLTVSERPIFMAEIVARSQDGSLLEIFGTGTAAVISAVNRIGYMGEDIHIPCGEDGMGQVAKTMLREITGRQTGDIDSDWSVLVN